MTAPLDALLRTPLPAAGDPGLLAALARAAAALARLDQATAGHPLLPALLHRARLDAVRRQVAVDGQLIDPWHLAALVEGLRPRRLDGARSIAEAGAIFEAGRTALAQYRWLTTPGFDEEGAVRDALASLRGGPATGVPLLDAAAGAWRWLDRGGARPALRAALVRFWMGSGLLRAPLPLTGAAALRGDADGTPERWRPALLQALAEEADETLNLLLGLERAWFAARRAAAGRRRHSRVPAAVDLLAAVPLLSATTLAGALGLSVKGAIEILDALTAAGVAVEVTGRAARRLFGLRGLAPLAAAVAPPRRSEPGRGPGRPRLVPVAAAPDEPPALAPLGPVERRAFDYSDLTAAMLEIEAAIRRTRDALAQPPERGPAAGPGGAHRLEDDWPEDPADAIDG